MWSDLTFQNEAYFSPREAYLPKKISCKFGEASWYSFPLRALGNLSPLKQSIHQMHPVAKTISKSITLKIIPEFDKLHCSIWLLFSQTVVHFWECNNTL